MAVKGRTGRSGLTPWANSWFVFKDTRGVTREQYLQQFVLSGEYLNNMDFVEILMAESYDRYLEVSSWGAQTGREYYYQPGTVTRSIEVVGSGRRHEKEGRRQRGPVARAGDDHQPDQARGQGHRGRRLPHGERPSLRDPGQGDDHVRRARPRSSRWGWATPAAPRRPTAMPWPTGPGRRSPARSSTTPIRPGGANPLVEPEPSPMMPATEMGGGPPSAPGPVETLEGRGLGLRIQSAYAASTMAACRSTRGTSSRPEASPGRQAGSRPGRSRTRPGYSTPGMSNHKGEGVFPQDLYGASNVPGLWAAGRRSLLHAERRRIRGVRLLLRRLRGAGGPRREGRPPSTQRARRAPEIEASPARDSAAGDARSPVSAARVFAGLGDQGAAGHHVPLLRDVREGEEQAGDGAQPDHVPAGEVRSAAQGGRPARASSGPRDPEHAAERRDEAPGRAGPGREPGHALSARTSPSATTPTGCAGSSWWRRTARWRWSSIPSRRSGTRIRRSPTGRSIRSSCPGRTST